jgi:hypothetical protein
MTKKTRYVIRIIAVSFLVGGGMGFLACPLTSVFGCRLGILDSLELPLGQLEGIAVDFEGNIYCGLQSYSRVQVYNPEGEFLYGKFINCSGGAFRIRINEDDQLEVATARNDKLYLSEKDGTIVREWSDVGHYFSDFGKTGETRFEDKRENVIYSRRGSLWDAHIFKRDSSGQETVIIRTPFHKWVFQGPLPAWLFFVIGGIMSVFASKWRQRGIRGMIEGIIWGKQGRTYSV